jgi:hypothetical protein
MLLNLVPRPGAGCFYEHRSTTSRGPPTNATTAMPPSHAACSHGLVGVGVGHFRPLVPCSSAVLPGSDRGDSLDTMEEIIQLEWVTVAAGAMSIESVDNTRVDGIARRMQQC